MLSSNAGTGRDTPTGADRRDSLALKVRSKPRNIWTRRKSRCVIDARIWSTPVLLVGVCNGRVNQPVTCISRGKTMPVGSCAAGSSSLKRKEVLPRHPAHDLWVVLANTAPMTRFTFRPPQLGHFVRCRSCSLYVWCRVNFFRHFSHSYS